jgi:hypothetical protein
MPESTMVGQCVEKLVLKYKNGAERKPVAAGTAVDYEQAPSNQLRLLGNTPLYEESHPCPSPANRG